MDAAKDWWDASLVPEALLRVAQASSGGVPSACAMLSELAQAVNASLVPQASQFLTGGATADGQVIDFQASCIETARRNNRLLREWRASWLELVKASVTLTPWTADAHRDSFRFWADQGAAALAPENFFWANAGAVKRFFDTNGESLANGYANWLRDVQRPNGLPMTADLGDVQIGRGLAGTPGAVVYRNHLLELIQYAPTTDTVHQTPIVFIQPWINKYYILDLTPANSMMAWLRDQGFLVFTVSWKNPGVEMRDVGFDDYVFRGALEAVQAVREITQQKAVHAVGFCIGGTALATLMAWLAHPSADEGEDLVDSPVAHWTLLATLVDFSNPGELGILADEKSLPLVEALMDGQGFLDGSVVESVFRLLRSESLIWHPAIRNYLYGDAPARSEVLYWNSDSTRLPRRMLSFYLQEFYINNQLVAEDGLVINGRRLHLGDIPQPLYAVGCIQDHIVPWTQVMRIRDLLNGQVRYALSSEGHIAGILNPPTSKSRRRFWVSDIEPGTDPQRWATEREAQTGSWWPDWANWLADRCGSQVPAPGLGSPKYPPLCAAPGSYVLE